MILSLGARDQFEIAPILGVLVGVVTALLLVSVLIVAALKIRSTRNSGSHALRPGFLAVKEKATLPLRSESEDLFEKDDKNPDIIPANKDSDYQLGSAAQTPGLNNSTASANYQMPQSQHITPISEAYLARDQTYSPQATNKEVTYAELQLVRPNSLEPLRNGDNQCGGGMVNKENSVIYAQIDHTKRAPPGSLRMSVTSPLTSPVSSLFCPIKPTAYHREIVTVRTPLMGCQQESCV
ncbi:uncharacterized protein LOC112905963 [Agrilus planipennis]|uniref:Uncharacterized protein LOC112905963 n=1 Tax=Agrilus planipennis TaxID=224129 RepID=A0A7F5RGX2_AGRPL|nr:uncharacterized protein LOC112905963 [Agrilus planipennis]